MKAGFADVGDSAIDDHAGIENLVAALRTGGAKETDEPRRLEPLAMFRAENETQIRQHDQDEAVQKFHAAIAVVCPEESRADRSCDRETRSCSRSAHLRMRVMDVSRSRLSKATTRPARTSANPTLPGSPTGSG